METPVFFSGETGKEHTHEIRIKYKMQYPVVSAVKEKRAKENDVGNINFVKVVGPL